MDSNSLSAGFYLSDYYEVIPEAEADDYLEALLNIIDKYNIEILMPSSGYDIFPFSEFKSKLKKHGVILVSDEKSWKFVDKIYTFNHLNKIFQATSTLIPDEIDTYPLLQNRAMGRAGCNSGKRRARKEIHLLKFPI
ncbi:MAG: hypothetical protein P0116_13710 [Candidatus Nitrosocosmicus sp.]|nr:hypothetical protein [Candidatus Nitrosocosmicus sp.]